MDDTTFRPETLDGYIGQEKVRQVLQMAIGAAKLRGLPVDNVLIFGAAGTGKTTVARIIAHEMGVTLHSQNGNSLGAVADMIAVLRGLKRGDVLHIDEAHGMRKAAGEILYTAMEDRRVDVIVGETDKIPLRISVPAFTVVLSTTRPDMIAKSLADRCGVSFRLKLYTVDELVRLLTQANYTYKINATADGLNEIARRGRGTPRVTLNLLRRVGDYALLNNTIVNETVAAKALEMLGVDELGLTDIDIEYLETLIDRFAGGPVGLISLAGAMKGNVTDDEVAGNIEPWLHQIGLVDVTARGRVATRQAYLHLGRELPTNSSELVGR